ncbi:transmembrane protease serine 11A [Perognathus longimembris pacificus]|uniref:transmembrane protease serine 11A n=1 Tax=Perognathus longimembris pacificus TaxID=214514 RepID=UPI002018C056|nr:transmembrane protease serine 11A [Perognathus longimembris pacificus]
MQDPRRSAENENREKIGEKSLRREMRGKKRLGKASPLDPKRSALKPWLAALLLVSSLTLAALAGLLLAHFLVSGQQLEYYHGILESPHPQVNSNTIKRSAYQVKESQEMSEHLVDEIFTDFTLNKLSIKNQVVRPIPEDDGKADTGLAFHIPLTVPRTAREKTIDGIFNQKTRKTRALPMNISSIQANAMSSSSGKLRVQASCGKRVTPLVVNRIMSGELAAKGAWPWQASLQRGTIHQCGATLISNTWLVTAAHCFKSNANPRQWTVSFGTTISPPLMRRDVRRIVVHERYRSPAREYDIALVQVTPRVAFTADVRPVCLPDASAALRPNATVYITGFGALYYGGESQNNLREARVRIISNTVCKQPHVYGNDIKFGMFCAGFLEGIYDACRGDSGGPLVIRDPNATWYLMGIVSWGDNCGQKNKPGVYTQVTYYRRWIASKTGL